MRAWSSSHTTRDEFDLDWLRSASSLRECHGVTTHAESDGIRGLGYPCLAAEGETLVFNMTAEELVNLSVFTVQADQLTAVACGAGSELIFRGYDHSCLPGDLSWVLVTKIQAEGTKMFGSVGHQVTVDPRDLYHHRPLGQQQAAAQATGAVPSTEKRVLAWGGGGAGKYVNIRALPEDTFTIPGVPYTLQPTIYILLGRRLENTLTVFLLEDDFYVGRYAGAAAWYLWFQEPEWCS
nr:PREDICTED: cathepsin E [Bos mutus]